MILGCLGGLGIGCLVGMLNFWFWYSFGIKKSPLIRMNAYWGTLIIVLVWCVLGAVTGILSGW